MGSYRTAGDLLTIACGPVYLAVMIALASVTLLGSVYLLAAKRNAQLLSVYLPLTFVPAFLGGLRTLLTLSMAVLLLQSAEKGAGGAEEALMLFGMSLLPALLGIVLSFPSFLVVAAGRAALLWRANTPAQSKPRSAMTIERAPHFSNDSMEAEAERYLARIQRNRE